MSKSFYKEEKRNLISHTTAKLAVSKLKRLKMGWVDKRTEIITLYITQQQKQEKLLNQIKDIINRPYDIASMLEESKRYVEIENLIKELENES